MPIVLSGEGEASFTVPDGEKGRKITVAYHGVITAISRDIINPAKQPGLSDLPYINSNDVTSVTVTGDPDYEIRVTFVTATELITTISISPDGNGHIDMLRGEMGAALLSDNLGAYPINKVELFNDCNVLLEAVCGQAVPLEQAELD